MDVIMFAFPHLHVECLRYLGEPCSNPLESLYGFPSVKLLFRKLNTTVAIWQWNVSSRSGEATVANCYTPFTLLYSAFKSTISSHLISSELLMN